MQRRIGLTCLLAAMVLAVAGATGAARAADAIPVAIDLTELRTTASYALEPGAPDDVYIVVNGVVKGEEVSLRLPKEGTWQVAPKKPGFLPPEKVTVWTGELAEGEFALLTFVLFQGKGENPEALKAYLAARGEAEKAVAERAKKTLTAAEFKKLATETAAAHQGLFKDDPHKFFSREKKTDHFNGQFTLTVFNDGGELKKRLDPLGLVHGTHFGEKEKLYTKIKFTKNNMQIGNDKGEFFLQVWGPVSDDGSGIRVKMLETEYVKKDPADPVGERNVTDYVVELKVRDLSGGGEGEALEWDQKGEHGNPDDPRDIHKYWDWAE